MGTGNKWPVAVASLLMVLVALPAGAEEPYWDAKPLSYWVLALTADSGSARTRAAQSVAEIALTHGGSAAASAVPRLLSNLDDADPAVRESTVHALEQIGAPSGRPAVGALVELMAGDAAPRVRRRAALALGRIEPSGGPAVDQAARSLRADPEASVRESAAVLLVASGPAAAPARAALGAALADEDGQVRLYAAAALAQSGSMPTGLPVLLACLRDESAEIRAEAAGLLPAVAPGREEVLPALVGSLKDDSPSVRAAAVGGIGAIGKAARPALPQLWALMRDPDEGVRERVLEAVRQIK